MSPPLHTLGSSPDDGDHQPIRTTPTVLVAGGGDDSVGRHPLRAARLEGYYTVRTATTVGDVFEELDVQVDVVLIDTRALGTVTEPVLDVIREHDLACRVAVLSETRMIADTDGVPVDASLVPPITGEEIRAVVERLTKYATYDAHCQEYFDLVERKMTIGSSSPGTSMDSDASRIKRRIAIVRRRMDRIVEDLVETEGFFTTIEGAVHTNEPTG